LPIIPIGAGYSLTKDAIQQIYKLWRRKKPLRITVESGIGDEWSVALPSREIMHNFSGENLYGAQIRNRLVERGGADFHATPIRLRIANISKDVVDVRNIRAVRTRIEPPFRAAKIFHSSAGDKVIPYLCYDLDRQRPAAFEMTFEEETGTWSRAQQPYFTSKYISLQPQETFETYVIGTTQSIYCEWHLEIDFAAGKKDGFIVAKNANAPFKTSGSPPGGFETEWWWVWWEQDPSKRGFRSSSEFLH